MPDASGSPPGPAPWPSWRLLAALLALHLVPVWIVPFFPSQDGPSHLYNARLITELLDPAHFAVRQYYEHNPALHPNLLAHLVLAGLQLALPPLVAEKILLSLLVVLLPLSLAYLLDAVERGNRLFALLGLVYAYSHLLHLGFYAFCLGVSLGFFTVGFWWRQRERGSPGARGVALLYALLAATWLAHFAAFGMVLLAIAACAGWSFALGARRSPGRSLRVLAVRAGVLLPAFAAALAYALEGREDAWVSFPNERRLQQIFFETMGFASYSDWHTRLVPCLVAVLVVAALAGALRRARRREWLLERDAFLILAVLLAVLFFVLPKSANQAGRINERVQLFFILYAAPWFVALDRRLRLALGAALVGISLAHAGRLCFEYAALQPELRDFSAARDLVEPHSSVAVERADDGGDSDAFPGGVRHLKPFLHAHAYYGLGRDVALFENYEVRYPYFPIRAGPAPREDPDYVIAWRLPAAALARREDAYEVAHRGTHLVLLRRRPHPPDPGGWEPAPGGGPVLRIPATTRLYTSGGRGWLRLAPRRLLGGEAVGGERDGVFRIDVPDGRYRVRCLFPAPATDRYAVDVVANDRRVVRRLAVRAGEADVPAGFEVDATRQRVVLVFHAPRPGLFERREPFWALASLEIERLPSATD